VRKDSTASGRFVYLLSDPSFAVREEASLRLAKMGPAALPALTKGSSSKNAEVRRRCALLLPAAQETKESKRLVAFLSGKASSSMPGWSRLRRLVGNDLAARVLYLQLDRDDGLLLEQLEEDPGKIGAEFNARCRLLERTRQRRRFARQPSPGEPTGLWIAACFATPKGFSPYGDLFCEMDWSDWLAVNPAHRRLAMRALENQVGTTSSEALEVVRLARALGLKEFLTDYLQPLARTRLQESMKQPMALEKVRNVVALAHALKMQTEVRTRFTSHYRGLVEGIARRSTKLVEIEEALRLAKTLGLKQSIDRVFKPLVWRLAIAAMNDCSDRARFEKIVALVEAVEGSRGRDKLCEAASREVAASALEVGNKKRIANALNLVCRLELTEARQGILEPAVRRHVLELMERTDDWQAFAEAATLAKNFGLIFLLRDTIEPAARRRALALQGQALSFAQIASLLRLSQQLDLNVVQTRVVKPALTQLIRGDDQRPLSRDERANLMGLAGPLGIHEATPMLLRLAKDARADASVRACAAWYVGKLGTPQQLNQLESLRTDETTIGEGETQLGDVVLAALIVGSKQDLDDYGDHHQAIDLKRYVLAVSYRYLSFPSQKERQAAHNKWIAESAKQRN
jgi:hypothetical protein